MEDYNNTIDLRFLDSETRIYDFSILIIYHKSQDAKFINSLRSKSNYMIYTNKSTNGMQDTFGYVNGNIIYHHIHLIYYFFPGKSFFQTV